MTKKYKEACKIIYKSTKEAIETGDKESLFLGDSRKLKSLVGTTCKRVKKTEFSEIYLDNLDILILHRCFLEKVWSAYYKSYGISEELKDVQFEGVSIEKDEMKKHIASFDFLLNTVAAPHNLDDYTALLKRDGTLCLVGLPDHPHPSPSVGNLIFKRRRIVGSLIGGLK